MGKRIDTTASDIVRALCADFNRRARAIEKGGISHRTEMEFRYLNYKILDAAKEIAGDAAAIFIREIGSHIGYARSAVANLSDTAYKTKKQEVIINIAKKLNFID